MSQLDGDAMCQPWSSRIIQSEVLGCRMHQLPYWNCYHSVRISCIALLCEWVPNSRTSASTLEIYCRTFQGFVCLMSIAREGLGSLIGFKPWCSDKSYLWATMLAATYVEGVGRLRREKDRTPLFFWALLYKPCKLICSMCLADLETHKELRKCTICKGAESQTSIANQSLLWVPRCENDIHECV